MTKISVIVPIYNTEEYLEECIKSILAQKFQDLEIILVNDGSLDDSLSICRKYEKVDCRVKVFDTLNRGVSVARNLGMSHAVGDYITFVDPDDWIAPEMYQEMYDNITTHSADVCMCGINNFKDGKVIFRDYLTSKDVLYLKNEVLDKLLPNILGPQKLKIEERTIMGSVWRLLIKRNILFDHNLLFKQNLSLSEDYLFCINLFLKTNRVYLLKECYYFYRLTNQSAVHQYREGLFELQKELYGYTEQIILNNEMYEKYQLRLNNLYFKLSFWSIMNELKRNRLNNRKVNIHKIKEILRDDKLNSIINYRDIINFGGKNRVILLMIKLKQANLIYYSYNFSKKFKGKI